MRFPQVGLGHRLGYSKSTQTWKVGRMDAAYLSVFKLLLDVCDQTATDLTHEASVQQFRAYLARPCNGSTDTHKRTDLVCSKIANARYEGKMIERDVELASLEVHRVGRCGRRVELQVVWFELCDETVQGPTDVWEEAVVLFLDRVC